MSIISPDERSRPFPAASAWGLGTIAAEFKDIRIEKDGQVFYASDFSKGANSGRPTAAIGPLWTARIGRAMRRSDSATLATRTWTDYTITLKARKISGAGRVS